MSWLRCFLLFLFLLFFFFFFLFNFLHADQHNTVVGEKLRFVYVSFSCYYFLLFLVSCLFIIFLLDWRKHSQYLSSLWSQVIPSCRRKLNCRVLNKQIKLMNGRKWSAQLLKIEKLFKRKQIQKRKANKYQLSKVILGRRVALLVKLKR